MSVCKGLCGAGAGGWWVRGGENEARSGRFSQSSSFEAASKRASERGLPRAPQRTQGRSAIKQARNTSVLSMAYMPWLVCMCCCCQCCVGNGEFLDWASGIIDEEKRKNGRTMGRGFSGQRFCENHVWLVRPWHKPATLVDLCFLCDYSTSSVCLFCNGEICILFP